MSAQWGLALVRLGEALSLSGRDPRYLERLGNTWASLASQLERVGRVPEAQLAYRAARSNLLEVTETRPHWPYALIRLALVSARLPGSGAESREFLDRAIAIAPDDPGVQAGVAQLVLGRPDLFDARMIVAALDEVAAGLQHSDSLQRQTMLRFAVREDLWPMLCARGQLPQSLRERFCPARE